MRADGSTSCGGVMKSAVARDGPPAAGVHAQRERLRTNLQFLSSFFAPVPSREDGRLWSSDLPGREILFDFLRISACTFARVPTLAGSLLEVAAVASSARRPVPSSHPDIQVGTARSHRQSDGMRTSVVAPRYDPPRPPTSLIEGRVLALPDEHFHVVDLRAAAGRMAWRGCIERNGQVRTCRGHAGGGRRRWLARSTRRTCQ